MKNRWWWTIVDLKDHENLNFLWTQNKKNDFILKLKQLKNTINRPKSCSSDLSTISTKITLTVKE